MGSLRCVSVCFCSYVRSCFRSLRALLNFSFARLGTHALTGASQFYRGISHFSSHPNYGANGEEYDIALVKLDKKVTYSSWVSPVALAAEDDFFNPKSECWVTGWGNVHEGSMFNTGSTSKICIIFSIIQSGVMLFVYI